MPDPALTMRFAVVVDGKPLGEFTGCEGLTAEYETYEYMEGGENTYVHRLPGRLKYGTVRLTRAVDQVGSQALTAWFTSLAVGVARVTAQITAYDGNGALIAGWNLTGVYPTRYTGPTFGSDQSQIAKEVLELSHDGFLGNPANAMSASYGR